LRGNKILTNKFNTMITNVYVKVWEGLNKSGRVRDLTNGTNYLLNGNRINGLEILSTTHAKFMFTDSLRNYREKASYLEVVESVQTIKTEIDKNWQSLVAPFDFYTDNDSTKATFRRNINVESIAYVYADPASVHRAFIVYYEGDKRMELLCSDSIKQVQGMLDGGTLVTTAG
jgi:hypothetical protein